jgi:hypothetical protein
MGNVRNENNKREVSEMKKKMKGDVKNEIGYIRNEKK